MQITDHTSVVTYVSQTGREQIWEIQFLADDKWLEV